MQSLSLRNVGDCMNKQYREPYLSIILLVLLVFEFPFFNLFLVIGSLMILISVVLYKRRPVINTEMIVLSLFIVLYFVIDDNLAQSNSYKFWYVLSTISMYTYGYYMDFNEVSTKARSKRIEYVISVVAISYTSYLLLTVFNSLFRGQFSISRNPLNIWTGTFRAATHYGTMSVIPLAFGLFLIFTGTFKWKRRLGIMIVLFTGMLAVMTASRTIILLIPIGSIFGYFANVDMQGVLKKRNLNQLLGAILLLSIGIFVFATNLFNTQSIFMSSPLGQRYLSGSIPTLENDGRLVNVRFFLEHIVGSIWGGGYTRQHAGNLHNVYLNVFDLSGIVPFLLLVLFTIMVVKDFKRLGQNKSVYFPNRLLLFLGFFLSFNQILLEPAMESVPVFMWCMFMICGMQRKVSRYIGEDLFR